MNSLKTRLAMSAVIAALAAGALAAHADPEIEQPATAESRQFEIFEHQLTLGSAPTYTPSEHAGSVIASAPAPAEAPRAGVSHGLGDSGQSRNFWSAWRASLKHTPVYASPFDDPMNTASPGG